MKFFSKKTSSENNIINNIYNYTIQYVDDSTNMLSSKNINELEIVVGGTGMLTLLTFDFLPRVKADDVHLHRQLAEEGI